MSTEDPEETLSITDVARSTGISRELLRKWEERYGFPEPARSAHGTRRYSVGQMDRLHAVKALVDSGMRPSKAIVHSLLGPLPPDSCPDKVQSAVVTAAMRAIQAHDAVSLQEILARDLGAKGLTRFVCDTVANLNNAVGEAWSQRGLRVFQEHVYSAVLNTILETAGRKVVEHGGSPRVALATVPGELHTLGLGMVRALFSEAGAFCLFLGAQVPLKELAAAVEAYRIELLGLSFSSAFPARELGSVLAELRSVLPRGVPIWVGGAGGAHLKRLPPDTHCFPHIADAVRELRTWRQAGK